jgi:PPK2 family polyphosphate:nucleotide phosphotransferase
MKEYRIKPGESVDLSAYPTLPEKTGDEFKEETRRTTAKLGLKLADLQELLYAQRKHRILIVLQGLDTAGKDGSIRNVFSSVAPEGLRVVAFKAPTQPELEHDYLWRVHDKVPGNGEIVIFNRSHYEEVLVVRVNGLMPEKVWRRRYRHMAEFERMLAEEGTLILKFFLHISKDEQKKRLEQRLTQKNKNWKWEAADLRDRGHWNEYWRAYEEAIERTSTDEAPWYVIPADKKWWRDYLISETLVTALEDLKMEYPRPQVDVSTIKID